MKERKRDKKKESEYSQEVSLVHDFVILRRKHGDIWTDKYLHIKNKTHTHILIWPPTYTLTHTHTHTPLWPLTYTLTHTHTNMITHTYPYTHTHRVIV